jgi:hypothetical protein
LTRLVFPSKSSLLNGPLFNKPGTIPSKRNRLQRRARDGLILLVVAILIALAPFLISPQNAWSFEIPTLSAVFAGFLVALALYIGSTPRLTASAAQSRYDGKSNMHWIHLNVQNRTVGFLGAGAVRDCRARYDFEDSRSFVPKWRDRPNPIRSQIVTVGPAHQLQLYDVADPHLYEQARSMDLGPDKRTAQLDVAFRVKGDTNCYISVPENWTTRLNATITTGDGVVQITQTLATGPLTTAGNAFDPNNHAFVLTLFDGPTVLFAKKFILRNRGGTDPGAFDVIDAPAILVGAFGLWKKNEGPAND